MAATRQDVTALLRAWSQGDVEAGERLHPTALVHETYLRLVEQRAADWHNRTQFFAVAARAMRRILVDHARRHGARKRGGRWDRITPDESRRAWPGEPNVDVLALE